MNNEPVSHSHIESTARRRFVIMMAGAILVSIFLVYVAMSLYRSSGTYQLDLSRPGYDDARQEATREREVFNGFASDGTINKQTLDEFNELYRQKAEEALSIDAFSGDALSDKTLSLD